MSDEDPQHVVVRLSNSQVALLAAVLNPRAANYKRQGPR